MRSISDWTLDNVLALVAAGQPESTELEYKASAALAFSDGARREISKDVSAMANASGGIIIYGVTEENHFPVGVDTGVADLRITREWLENIITSNIRPSIPGLVIKAITLGNSREIFVISIPQSTTLAPHQARDNRYYRRRNFQCEPMEDAEIRDVMRRADQAKPTLEIDFRSLVSEDSNEANFTAAVMATAETAVPVLYAHVIIGIDKRLFKAESAEQVPNGFSASDGLLNRPSGSVPCRFFTRNITVPHHMPLFIGQSWLMANFSLAISGIEAHPIYWAIKAPGALASETILVALEDGKLVLRESVECKVTFEGSELPVSAA